MSLLGMGVAGIAIAEAIPLGRVWSFPKEIVVTNSLEAFALVGRVRVGDTIRLKMPQRWVMASFVGPYDPKFLASRWSVS